MGDDFLGLAIHAAQKAGVIILKHYRQEEEIKVKRDGSPLTLADAEAHDEIVSVLASSNIPLVSEEGSDLFLDAQRYWLIDPLDGTKDFIAANDEFTVNIALVEGTRPVLGVVFAPALNQMYFAEVGIGSWQIKGETKIALRSVPKSPLCRMAVSRFHDHPDVDVFARINGIESRLGIGSALKYCRLAAGEIDVFPRLVGSSEWDTAAGQAILEGVGGHVLNWHTGQALTYGKLRRRNPRLLSIRSPYQITDFELEYYQQELL